jgi:ABC-2 type transport system ATP-binding protein
MNGMGRRFSWRAGRLSGEAAGGGGELAGPTAAAEYVGVRPGRSTARRDRSPSSGDVRLKICRGRGGRHLGCAIHPPARQAVVQKISRERKTRAMLEAINLSKSYNGQPALDALNLRIAPGEIFCLLGANGAGKTTTINLFLNFVEPSAGKALIKGLDVAARPLESKRHIAYIPEQVMLYRNLTGLENLEYFSALAGRDKHKRDELLSFFREVGLSEEAARKRVSAYSKGMRQKVGIAIALAKRAEALLLDEPTSGLDPKASNEFSGLLRKLSAQGVAVLMATHDLFRAKESGARVGIMRQGKLVREMSTLEIGHADLERVYLEHMRD